MLKKPPPHNVFERVRERDRQAEDHLAGKGTVARGWGKAHLWVGDMADKMYAFTGNEYVSAAIGLVIGLARGAVYGLFGALLAVTVPYLVPSIVGVFSTTLAAAIFKSAALNAAWGFGLTTAACGIHDCVTFFRESRADSAQAKGKKAGDAIARHGGALDKGISKAEIQAVHNLRAQHQEPKPPEPPLPKEGENHRFAEALKQQRQLEQQTRLL